MICDFVKEVILYSKFSVNCRAAKRSNTLKGMILRRTLCGTINLNLTCLFFLFGVLSVSGVSQSSKVINLEEIPQRKVRKYIVSSEIDQMNDFSAIHASWKEGISESGFHIRSKTFYLEFNLSNVWECYRHTGPEKMWNGQFSQLGLLISKCSNTVIYANNSYFPEIDTGQVCFLNLRIMRGLFNVPVAFEVINIDNNKHILEVSYIENNKSKGKQTIQFFDNGDGCTRIVHGSYFKSKSWLYDDIFYPYFHKKIIKEFHRKMGQIVKNANPIISG